MSAALTASDATIAKTRHAPSRDQLRLAYLTTEYPKVSHTFIRREILELERRGHSVLRLAIRGSGGAIADASDREEAKQTFVCLDQSLLSMAIAVAAVKVRHPLRWIAALGMTWRMSRASDRGLLRHLAYLWEAAVLLQVCRKHRVQHVHVHFGTNSAAVARLIKCLSGGALSYSMTVHGPDEFDSPRAFSLGEKVADASFTCAISDFCSAQLRRWSDAQHWGRIHVVRCTVGEEFFEHARPVNAASRTLLSIGRLSAQKGQLLLIDAMRRLHDAGVDAQLVLAGDGEMRGEIESAIARHRLQSVVRITGWIDEQTVREHLLAARALVQPSFAEGLPVVMMEALAMQRPVIATAIAGVPELVIDGECGWIVPAGNVELLVNAMKQAIETPVERLHEMGRRGADVVRARHFTPTQVDRLEQLLCGGTT